MQNKFAKNISTVSWQMIALAAGRAGPVFAIWTELFELPGAGGHKLRYSGETEFACLREPKGGSY